LGVADPPPRAIGVATPVAGLGWPSHPQGLNPFFLKNNKIIINGLSPQHLWKKYELLIAKKHFSYKKGLKILFSELELLKYNFFQKLKL
jgi:hypothetical protein